METLVGIGPETIKGKGRVFDSGEEDRTDPNSRRRDLTLRRADRSLQSGTSTEATTHCARADRKISSAIQGTGKTVAAGNRDDRKRGNPQSEITSGTDVRACA